VNQLRQLMLEELQRRNFAETTIRTYLHGVAHFSRYSSQSAAGLPLMLEQNEMVLKLGQVRIQDRGEGTVRRTFDRYGNLTHDFLTSPEHAGLDSTQMEERGYRVSGM
jgi:hypothetical protein